jgi:hypothetical protein
MPGWEESFLNSLPTTSEEAKETPTRRIAPLKTAKRRKFTHESPLQSLTKIWATSNIDAQSGTMIWSFNPQHMIAIPNLIS